MKEHPHDVLIHKLEECLDELRELGENHIIDTDEFDNAFVAVDNAVDEVRAINL